jgi:predicted nucleotidyltransferase
MMTTLDTIRSRIREHQEILAQRYGIAVVGLFGSRVRGDEKPGSDLDVLADVLRPISLLELVGAELYLSDLLGVKVDLVPRRSVREELREAIWAGAVAP